MRYTLKSCPVSVRVMVAKTEPATEMTSSENFMIKSSYFGNGLGIIQGVFQCFRTQHKHAMRFI